MAKNTRLDFGMKKVRGRRGGDEKEVSVLYQLNKRFIKRNKRK
jgi:hypothetical protein